MKRHTRTLTTLALSAAFAVALASSPAFSQKAKDPGHKGKTGGTTMQEMMGSCHERQSANMTKMDEMMAMMDRAEKSNDKSEMQKALQQAQTDVRALRKHTETCMEHMKSMSGEKTHMMDHDGMKKGGEKSGGDDHTGHKH